MNQNFIVCIVLRKTLRIIIDANLCKIREQRVAQISLSVVLTTIQQTRCNREDVDLCMSLRRHPSLPLPSDALNTDEILTPGQISAGLAP
jgi:hypothetical protein